MDSRLPKPVRDELTFEVVKGVMFAVLQSGIAAWIMSVVRHHRRLEQEYAEGDAFQALLERDVAPATA